MENELATTSGAQAIKGAMHKMIVAIVHLWLWNLTHTFIEFTIYPSDIEMRSDAKPIAGHTVKVRIWLEPLN